MAKKDDGKKKAVRAVEKAVRKATKKGISEETLAHAVKKGIQDAAAAVQKKVKPKNAKPKTSKPKEKA
jgi:hypothetical protein